MQAVEPLNLKEETNQSLAEARMILPGIQALLGFQTMAVFNQRFTDLSSSVQYLHLFSLLLIILSTVFAMTPTALYRLTAHGVVTDGLLRTTTVLLCAAMLSLSLSLSLDSYVVATLVFRSQAACLGFAVLVLCLCWSGWFLFPLLRGKVSFSTPG